MNGSALPILRLSHAILPFRPFVSTTLSIIRGTRSSGGRPHVPRKPYLVAIEESEGICLFKNAMLSQAVDVKTEYGFTDQEWEEICQVEKKQKDFHELLRGQSLISDEEKKSLSCTSYDDFAAFSAERAQKIKSDYDLRRSKGWKRLVGKLPSFAAGANRFMKDFSPIVELARTSGPPYSGLAVGTICMLFTIAEHRIKTDEVIASAIADIQDRLPGFQMYEEIYKGNDKREKSLKKSILLTYSAFVEFSIEATKFYLNSGIRRWWSATWSPTEFESKASKVQDLVVGVRQQCEDLLSWNVNVIRLQNEELIKQISKLQDENDNRNLSAIQDLLELPAWTLAQRQKELEEYKKSIDRECCDDMIFEYMRPGSISKYKSKTHFKEWEKPDRSTMLLLIGSNHETVMGLRNHCWLSPLALELIDNFTTNSTPHAFYAFKISESTPMFPAVSEILFQLLKLKKREFGSEEYFANLRANLNKYRAVDIKVDEDAKLDALGDLAKSTMKLFKPNETVHIVLDRIDRCKIGDRVRFLDLLISMMEEAVGSVKILAVANKTGWDIRERDVRRKKPTIFKQVIERQKILFDG